MSEEISYIPEPSESFDSAPEKKSKKTLWIVLGIVAVVLLCCCLVSILGAVLGFIPVLGEMMNEFMFEISPYLSLV